MCFYFENYDAPCNLVEDSMNERKERRNKNDNKTVANMTNQIDLHNLKCKLSSAHHLSSSILQKK